MGSYDDLDRPPLRAPDLNRALVIRGGLWSRVQVMGQTTSTNEQVRAAALAGEPEGLVVVAEEQTAGRGRLGREWHAPARSGLTFAVLLRPEEVPTARWGWLPLLTGLAVTDALRRVAEVDARLKWPNDVLVPTEEESLGEEDGRLVPVTRPVGDRKVAGVLVERVDQPRGGAGAAVVGVGLNVSLRAEELPVATATSLALAGAACLDRATLLAALLRELAVRYGDWRVYGGDADRIGLRAEYTALCATVGRNIRVTMPGARTLAGVASGLDEDGRLLLSPPGAGEDVVRVSAGDVVHVR